MDNSDAAAPPLPPEPAYHFDVSTGLKRVLGRELITNDEVAIFEMVKNSFDASADEVHLFFGEDEVIVADNGTGMSYDDLNEKWLFVAYSAKRDGKKGDFRDIAAERSHYAGSKGIGRFSSDRLGEHLTLQSRPKGARSATVHKLDVEWSLFEEDEKQRFETIPVEYAETKAFDLPKELGSFGEKLKFGTVIRVSQLRRKWGRDDILGLKASLAKLINPFGAGTDSFSIFITAPAEKSSDAKVRADAKAKKEEPQATAIVNGRVGNFIFGELQAKTTYISVWVEGEKLETTLHDRGELVYRIREPNPYPRLKDSGFRCEIYYLNRSARLTFARRVGLPIVQFGSVFLFRNGFRVYPIGETKDDWFGFDRRKQQGYNRFLGTREIIGRVDVFGSDEDFQEASSRNAGLIETPAVRQLHAAVMEHCLKRLEKYVVPVSWADKLEADTEDLSRLLTDPGRARVSAAIANLVDNVDIELVDYSRQLVGLLNERSSEFETSLTSLRSIAEKSGDKTFISDIDKAEKRFEELRKSEAEARKVADKERAAAAAATARAETAEATADLERRRALFLQDAVKLDTATILNLHHQVTIYSVDIAQQIENFLAETAGQKMVPRETVLAAMEQMAFLNRKVHAITRFAAKANFKLDSEQIEADLPVFVSEYIQRIARASGSARTKIVCNNSHTGMVQRFNPIDVSIIVDNLISNARRAGATRITFNLEELDRGGLSVVVHDNGPGLSKGVDPNRIFEMGYTSTHGSGLGLYHVRQVLGEMGGSVDFTGKPNDGATFTLKFPPKQKAK